MKTMTKLSAAIVLMLALSIYACATVLETNKTPYWSKSFTLDGPGSLEVKTSGGSITVEGHKGNRVRVEMYVNKNGRQIDSTDAKASEVLENYEITISKTGSKISAIAKGKNNNWFSNTNTSISFKVLVPEQMTCDLNTSGGSINLSGVAGSQKLNTSGGSLTIHEVNGNMSAKTSGGSIHVEKYNGSLDAHTSGGTINLTDAKGTLKVSTSGGSINLKNVAGGIDASTSGGSINANITSLTNSLNLRTSGGSITAVIPANLGLDLDLKGNSVNTQLANFNGDIERDKVTGKLNGGGISVKMSTSGGSVNLKYQ